MTDLRSFLRLQSDVWLRALRDKIAEDILANVRTTSFSYVGKAGTSDVQVPTADLAQQLADVIMEKGLDGASAVTRMTAARFV